MIEVTLYSMYIFYQIYFITDCIELVENNPLEANNDIDISNHGCEANKDKDSSQNEGTQIL